MAKRASGEGSIYRAADGWWHASLSRGVDPASGRRIRTHVMARTKQEARAKLDAVLESHRAGTLDRRSATVDEWLDEWIAMADRSLKPSTVAGYRVDAKRLRAKYGHLRIGDLSTRHIEMLYDELAQRGLSSASVAGVHRSIRASLNEAVRRGWIEKNPARFARPGRVVEKEVEPLTREETRAILDVAATHRNGTRWAIALALGLRQGEALGLGWDDIDLDTGQLRVRRAIQRVPHRHGCAPPCGLKAKDCPRRRDGGIVEMDPKSRSGRRTIVMPAGMAADLRSHLAAQKAERIRAGSMWRTGPHGGWVFATETGAPTDPRRDWGTWKALLAEAGVRDVRLHDARHSAATYLLVQGVDARTVMGILGWSQVSLTARYQHVVPELMEEAASRMNDYLWGDGRRPAR